MKSPVYNNKIGNQPLFQILVKNLPVGCAFNIIKFGSAFHFFRDAVQNYDKRSVQDAERWIERLSSDLGGTDILS